MNAYSIRSADGGGIAVYADSIETRNDGSLWVLVNDQPIVVLARSAWSSVYVGKGGSAVPVIETPPEPPAPAKTPRAV